MIITRISAGIHKHTGKKLKLWWHSWKARNETTRCLESQPSASAFGLRSAPSAQPEHKVVSNHLFLTSMKRQKLEFSDDSFMKPIKINK